MSCFEDVATVGADGQSAASRKLRRCVKAEGGGTVHRLDLAHLELVAVRIGVVRQDAVRHLLALRHRLAVVLWHRRIVLAGNDEGDGGHVGTTVAVADGVLAGNLDMGVCIPIKHLGE